jgi:hypothetical protein
MKPILFREAALNQMFDLLLVTTSQKEQRANHIKMEVGFLLHVFPLSIRHIRHDVDAPPGLSLGHQLSKASLELS